MKGGAIIIAGSGMCDAGRIRHHLKQNLWRSSATVLLVGYQAPGSLGSLLAAGAGAVTIFGEDLRVKAAIRQIDVYSGHADGDELINWLMDRMPVKSGIFLTHGEEEALSAMRAGLEAKGVEPERIVIPQLDDAVDLSAGHAAIKFKKKARRLTPEAVRGPDWHNDLAEFTLRLREKMEAAADDRSRRKIIRRVVRALDDPKRL